jgi:poly(A)-specific ribonuclease
VEALVGGDLDELDPKAFSPLMNKYQNPAFDIKQLADRVKGKLKQNRPVLVGHNIFCDLLFFYRCFIGPLPNTLEEFIAAIHDLFPVLADTKYLATYDCGALAPESSLEDLNRNLAHFETPKIGRDWILI